MVKKKDNFFFLGFRELILTALNFLFTFLFYNFSVDSLFDMPSYVYTGLMVIFFVLGLYFGLLFLRKWIWSHFEGKQYNPSVSFLRGRPPRGAVTDFRKYRGFLWKSAIEIPPRNRGIPLEHGLSLDGVEGPLCPKYDCKTSLVCNRTFFGRFAYSCPRCNFKKKSSYSGRTLERDFEKVMESEIHKEDFKDELRNI
ncbi:hypothetical protein CHL76_16550 [Marinococcus halophilus]|uniref:Uncharacterized protein n=1 Tax=Marinococcus halophilus TaxID=1371 RepID=P71523_MARHA|nr:hypothetical protein [Marinococcus halophilus]AAC45762.1 unknown [Marinococcus halophilus]OZT78714.1 hypothetical protein CHL76_16550 [Marinococcus halophilus]